MKQIFFKTVRNNGTSVWAIGKYQRLYEVGKHYTFDPRTPAHVFGMEADGRVKLGCNNVNDVYPEQTINHDLIYSHRAESNAGNRVLICYGEVKAMEVPCFDIYHDWDFSDTTSTEWRWTSNAFDVIGEIKPSRQLDWQDGKDNNHCKVIVDI